MEIKHIYSYTATFEDGTQIVRDMNDPNGDKCLSRTDGTGSRFTDVQEKEKESKLICFVVHNDEESWGVDLRDGHFEFNGRAFWLHRPDLTNYKDFRIIHTRTVRRTLSPDGNSAELLGYNLGWQTNDKDGKNVKEIITF